ILFFSIFRPYVNRNWSIRKRIISISEHYNALSTRRARPFDIPAGRRLSLATIERSLCKIEIIIDRPDDLRSEGEICASLMHEGKRIYVATFLIGGRSNGNSLIIGGFQGSKRFGAKEIYVKLTRAFHGLRPRDLLVNVLKMLGLTFGCNEIKGISSEAHR